MVDQAQRIRESLKLDNWAAWADLVERTFGGVHGQRRGQFLFNELFRFHPGLARRLSGSMYDPFYDDKKINAFLSMVDQLWEGTL